MRLILQCPQGLRAGKQLPALTMASQQPVKIKPLHPTKPSPNCTRPWTRRAVAMGISDKLRRRGQASTYCRTNGEAKPSFGKGIGPAGHAERLSDVDRQLPLGTAQHHSGKETFLPRPHGLL